MPASHSDESSDLAEPTDAIDEPAEVIEPTEVAEPIQPVTPVAEPADVSESATDDVVMPESAAEVASQPPPEPEAVTPDDAAEPPAHAVSDEPPAPDSIDADGAVDESTLTPEQQQRLRVLRRISGGRETDARTDRSPTPGRWLRDERRLAKKKTALVG